MSKHIDFSKPLSEDDKAYVAERPWLLQDARLRGEDIIDDDEFTVADDEDESTEPETGDDESDETPEESEDEADNEDGEGDEDEVAPYAEWDYAALKDEAKNRDLSAAGSKEQLIKRLEEDDASAPE